MLSADQLTQLWHLHATALLLLARGYGDAAEDCVQEAFVRLATQQPAPHNPAAWLFRVVRNEAISQQRSRSRRIQREKQVARDATVWFEETTGNEADVQAVLSRLDSVSRDVVVAHLWGGMTFRDIADAWNVSRATAHRRYHDAIRELQQHLGLSELSTTADGDLPATGGANP